MKSPRRLSGTRLATWLFVLSFGAGALEPRSVWAEGPPAPSLSEALTGQAKDDYVTGRVLFDNGDFAGALVKFHHAFDVSTDVRLLWNMGACEKNLHHYVHVLRLVDRYLQEGGAQLTDAQRAEAASVTRTVHSLVSEVHLIVNEAGASVFVDDEPAGTTPLMEGLLVDLGDRRIRVSKPGFTEQVIAQHLAGASEVTVSVALEREVRQARLVVSTDAAGAIQLDGAAVGFGHWEGAVSPGSHALRITAAGMRPYSTEIAFREGETRALDAALQKDSSGLSPVWWIGGGVLVAAGLGIGGYFLFRPARTTAAPTPGTITPGTLTIP